MAGVLALIFGVAGCGGSDKKDSAVAARTLVIALPSQPENLNPIYGDSVYSGSQKAFNGLLRYKQDLSPEPELASALPERSLDGRTVTVKLRDDVTFSDGTAFTAKDVVFTYKAILDKQVASPLATLLDSLDSVKAIDDTTVEFDLNRPDPAFYDKLQIGIVPEHLLAGKDLKTAAFNRKPVGTGPYVVTEFQPGGRIVMQANPRYFRGSPKIERLVLTAVEDENARVALRRRARSTPPGSSRSSRRACARTRTTTSSRYAPPTPASPRCPIATRCCAIRRCGARCPTPSTARRSSRARWPAPANPPTARS